jgi:hypothetical protein
MVTVDASHKVFLGTKIINDPRIEVSKNFTIWLVVSTPLKNISQWEGLSHILWKIKNVPNHQPDLKVCCTRPCLAPRSINIGKFGAMLSRVHCKTPGSCGLQWLTMTNAGRDEYDEYY